MITLLKVFTEAIRQAWQQLTGNKLRTALSLLGIVIGIWCIVTILSAVDSLNRDIRASFERLGNDVVYISRFSWAEDPGDNWWKIMRRPNPDYEDYQALRTGLTTADQVTYNIFMGRKEMSYKGDRAENVFTLCVTEGYADIFNIDFEKGRFFSPTEYNFGSPVVVIGHEVAKTTFGESDPIGKQVKLYGRRMTVIGVIAKTGNNLINPLNFDECAILSYPMGRKLINTRSPYINSSLNAKARSTATIEDLEDEVTAVLRSERRLRPREENDFAINNLSILSNVLDTVFGTLNVTGFVIGSFAMFVGMFSVANIMFVSVKERTSIIGVKKAIGAQNYVILLEFLVEAVILCLIGGGIGLLLVWAVTLIATQALDFEIVLSTFNVTLGILISVVVGVLSGIIPAFQASRLDPVEAMRS